MVIPTTLLPPPDKQEKPSGSLKLVIDLLKGPFWMQIEIVSGHVHVTRFAFWTERCDKPPDRLPVEGFPYNKCKLGVCLSSGYLLHGQGNYSNAGCGKVHQDHSKRGTFLSPSSCIFG